jgi:hypothetical protein
MVILCAFLVQISLDFQNRHVLENFSILFNSVIINLAIDSHAVGGDMFQSVLVLLVHSCNKKRFFP